MVSIVILQHIKDVDTLLPQNCSCAPIHIAARCIRGAIGTVAADAEYTGAFQTFDTQSCS